MMWYRNMHALLLGLILALAPVAAAVAADATTGSTTSSTTTVTTTTDTTEFSAPVATPMGQGWYAASSTIGQNGWMSRRDPWSDDLAQIRGTARAAVVAASPGSAPGIMASTGSSGGTNRLVTGVAQWVVPDQNFVYEVRFRGLSSSEPFGGAGLMRAVGGETGIGPKEMPRSMAYMNVSGPVDVIRNGQTIASNLPGRILVTQGIRDPQNGRLLNDVRTEDLTFHVFVNGEIPGVNNRWLYVFWPSATIDLRNLSAPVALLPSEMQTARSFFSTSAVAGIRETPSTETTTARLMVVSLRDRYLARSTAELPAGSVDLRIVNDSGMARGFFIQGPGIEQRTRILQPGEQVTLNLTLQPGSYRIASFRTAEPRTEDYTHWDLITVR